MPTMGDIAKELGVSKSTVSKALSGAKDISEAMRQTILKKSVEMGLVSLQRTPFSREFLFKIETV